MILMMMRAMRWRMRAHGGPAGYPASMARAWPWSCLLRIWKQGLQQQLVVVQVEAARY
jgi:hypothetical protein